MSSPRTDIRKLATARLISQLGSEAAYTALLFVLYQRTHSAGWVATALLATFGTQGVMTAVAGSLGDRFDRRLVMIFSDLGGAMCFASLGFVHSPGALVLLAFLAAAVEAPFLPASSAAVPNLAGDQELAWATGTVQTGGSLGHLIGPFVGGALVAAIGSTAVFELNAASFLVSVALVWMISGRFAQDRAGDSATHQRRGMREGFAFVLSDPVLRRVTVAFSVFVLAVGSVLVAELPLVQKFGVGAMGYGAIGLAWGGGALLGALAARSLTERTERRALVWCSYVTAVGILVIAFLPAFAPILVALFVAGLADAVVDVAVEAMIQRRTPDHVRSRVSAAIDAVLLTVFAASFLFAGAIVRSFGPKAAYAVAGVGCLITATFLLPLARRSDLIVGAEDAVADVPGPGGEPT
jgi:MFS family permease